MEVFLSLLIIGVMLVLAYRFILRTQIKIVDLKIKEMKQLADHNNQVVNSNKFLMNQIEIGTYQYKEHVLWMYNHYKDMLLLICNVNPNNKEVLDKAAEVTKNSMDAVGQNFKQTFGVSPEKYVEQKHNMTYTNKQGISYPSPNVGVN